jgi:transposase-like protein
MRLTLYKISVNCSRFDLGEKIAIVREAYEQPKRLYATAKKYGVDLRNIKQWRKLLDAEKVGHGVRMLRLVTSLRIEGQEV